MDPDHPGRIGDTICCGSLISDGRGNYSVYERELRSDCFENQVIDIVYDWTAGGPLGSAPSRHAEHT